MTPAALVLLADSVTALSTAHAGCVLVAGSHGGNPESALPVDARAAFFHDAGIGIDEAGTTRLPALAMRGMPAGTVDYRSARIGDARSLWARPAFFTAAPRGAQDTKRPSRTAVSPLRGRRVGMISTQSS